MTGGRSPSQARDVGLRANGMDTPATSSLDQALALKTYLKRTRERFPCGRAWQRSFLKRTPVHRTRKETRCARGMAPWCGCSSHSVPAFHGHEQAWRGAGFSICGRFAHNAHNGTGEGPTAALLVMSLSRSAKHTRCCSPPRAPRARDGKAVAAGCVLTEVLA